MGTVVVMVMDDENGRPNGRTRWEGGWGARGERGLNEEGSIASQLFGVHRQSKDSKPMLGKADQARGPDAGAGCGYTHAGAIEDIPVVQIRWKLTVGDFKVKEVGC